MMIRFQAGTPRPAAITLLVDGSPLSAPEGEPLATALGASGLLRLRDSPRTGAPRGAFCFMGACQECLVHVDGIPRQACMTPVRHGMVIERRGMP